MKTRTQVLLSIMMFFEFFVWGAWFVPMYPYLKQIGFTDPQIAYAYATTAIAAIISPFFIGMVADRFFAAEKVLGILQILGGAALIAVSFVQEFSLFFPVLLFYTLTYMPTLALTNSIAFEQMTNPEKEFPPIRVLGTIGWIVAGLLIGFGPKLLLDKDTISNTSIPMQIAGCVAIALGFFCFFLPHTPPKKATGEKATVSDVLCLKALGMLKDPPFAIFVIGSFLICIPLAFYYQTANGFLTDVGMPYATGWQTLGQVSEILFMLLMPLAFVLFGVKRMLLIGMLAWVLRYVMFAFGGTEHWMPYALLFGGILLHGICYDFFFVTGFIYVDKKAPADVRASAQGFIALVTQGLGMLIGNYINGQVNKFYTVDDAKNWMMIWLIPMAMAGAVMIFFAIVFNDKSVDQASQGQTEKETTT